jgi:hypothetical protein
VGKGGGGTDQEGLFIGVVHAARVSIGFAAISWENAARVVVTRKLESLMARSFLGEWKLSKADGMPPHRTISKI